MNRPAASTPNLHERVGTAALCLLVGMVAGLGVALVGFALAVRPEGVSIGKCVFGSGAVAAAFGFAYPVLAMRAAEAVVHFFIGALGSAAERPISPEPSAPASLKYALLAGTVCGLFIWYLLWW